jgi:hypothetical protein
MELQSIQSKIYTIRDQKVMLASVLKSFKARKMNMTIVRAFIALRPYSFKL